MSIKTLTPFPYYGGKAKMAPLICDMLDYNTTDIYIEPFGGACRVLLNKPRHKEEIYNEPSAGVCAFMRVMSNRNTAQELIDRLYLTEYSLEEYYRALLLRNEAEDNFIDEFRRQSILYIKQIQAKYNSSDLDLLLSSVKKRHVSLIRANYLSVLNSKLLSDDDVSILKCYYKQFEQYVDIFNSLVLRAYKKQYKQNFIDFRSKAAELITSKLDSHASVLSSLDVNNKKGKDALENKIININSTAVKLTQINVMTLGKKEKKALRAMSLKQALNIAYSETSNNHDNTKATDMELAVASYIIYAQSRDGIGKDWSPSKYKSTDDYHNMLSRLRDVSERLEGVTVTQGGALLFFLKRTYLDNDRAMIYCDPSYLKPGDEKRDLGKGTYKYSYSYADHEQFLKSIYKAKCKLLVSNYDTELYNRYLNEKYGWNRIEVKTKTSVGSVKNNERIEVLWYNY